jgi:hypothetical protein
MIRSMADEKVRKVRGDSGALFDVDPSMVDAPPETNVGFRDPAAAPPGLAAIKPAPPPPPRVSPLVGLTLTVLALFALFYWVEVRQADHEARARSDRPAHVRP